MFQLRVYALATSTMNTFSFNDLYHLQRFRAMDLRCRLLLGILGVLAILMAQPLWDSWVLNTTGILINRAVVTDTETDLTQSMALLEVAASREPHTVGREIPIWRTYAAAAGLDASEHAFELLVDARDAGLLDRVGELWLGEVASATQHWEEATDAYRRIDASNILIHRADTYLEAGEEDLAIHEYILAKMSLEAAAERDAAEQEAAEQASLGNNGASEVNEAGSTTGGSAGYSVERVTALYRIGRGLLAAGEPLRAIPVLEQALAKAAVASPGAVTEQSLILNLALALAQTLPEEMVETVTSHSSLHDPDSDLHTPGRESAANVLALDRIRALVYRAIESDRTSSVYVQVARIMLLTGDYAQATSWLREAIALDPLLAASYLVLGGWYEGRGLLILAREVYEEGAQALPADPEIAAAYAIASYNTLRADEALPVLEQAASTDSADPYLFAFLGDCYIDLGRITEARNAYQEGLRRNPGAQLLLDRLDVITKFARIWR